MKHSFEVKLAAVNHYLAGHAGIISTAKLFQLSHTSLSHWINLFLLHGPRALDCRHKRSYSPEDKLCVVLYALGHSESLPRVAARFNIPSHNTVKNWIKGYRKSGNEAFIRRRKEKSMTRSDDTHEPEGIEVTVHRQRVIVRCPAVPVSLMAVLQVDRGLPVLEVLVERDGVQLLLTSREVIPVTGIEVLVHRHVIAFREAVTRKSDIRIHFIKTFGIAQTPGFSLFCVITRYTGHGLGYVSGNSAELTQVPAQPHSQSVIIPGNNTASIKRPRVTDTPGCLTGSKDRTLHGVLIGTRTTGNQLVTNLARTGQIRHICRVHLERFFPPVLLDNFNIQAATHGAVQVLNGERTCRHSGVIEYASLLRNHDTRIRIRNP